MECGGSLERQALPEEAFGGGAAASLALRGRALPLPAELLASSFVLRKLAVAVEGGFAVDLHCPVTAEHCATFLHAPPGARGLLRWLRAADFLLAQPSAPQLMVAVHSCLGPYLCSRRLARPDAVTPADRHPPPFLAGRAPPALEGDDYDRPEQQPDRPERRVAAACDEDGESWSVLDFAAALRRVDEMLMLASRPFAFALHAELLKRGAVAAVLHRCSSGAGAVAVLDGARTLLDLFGASLGGWLVYRALRSAYCRECGGEALSVPLSAAADLQRLYCAGRLTLDHLLPLDRTCAVDKTMLPGLRGRADVAQLLGEGVAQRLVRAVPWLEEAAAWPAPLHLAGSLLVAALTDHPPDADWPGPGDVDLYCERAEELPAAREQVLDAMRRRYGQPVVAQQSGSSTRTAFCSGRGDSFDRRADVYVCSTPRVMQYHLPVVRASFDLRTRELFLAPSCACALITGLNVDCRIFKARKTPQQILASKWLQGYNTLLHREDAEAMRQHLREHHGEALRRAEGLGRPVRLRLASYAAFEATYAGA